jgi:hypothetical protein
MATMYGKEVPTVHILKPYRKVEVQFHKFLTLVQIDVHDKPLYSQKPFYFTRLLQRHQHLLDVTLCSRGLVLYSGKYSYIIFCWKDYQVMWHQVSSVYMSRLRWQLCYCFMSRDFLFFLWKKTGESLRRKCGDLSCNTIFYTYEFYNNLRSNFQL